MAFIQYKPELSSKLSDIHHRFARSVCGIMQYSPEYWEGIFARPEIDPKSDIIIAAAPTGDKAGKPAGFCWLYVPNAPRCVYIRGPYIEPDNPHASVLLESIIKKAVEVGEDYGAGFIEGRSYSEIWDEGYMSNGFTKMGAYERWRLFPLKGSVAHIEAPKNGRVRGFEGMADLDVIADLFTSLFGNHWDYVPIDMGELQKIFSGKGDTRDLTLFAYEGKIPVGYIFGQPIVDYSVTGLKSAYLVSIAVKQENRGKGWGHVLMSNWLRQVYKSGMRASELDVDVVNAAAKKLYGDFGYRMMRTEVVWRKDMPTLK